MNKPLIWEMLLRDVSLYVEDYTARIEIEQMGITDNPYNDISFAFFRFQEGDGSWRKLDIQIDENKLAKMNSQAAVSYLAEILQNNVTLVSFALNRLFPDEFVFFHSSALNSHILTAIDFFSEVVPEFRGLENLSLGKKDLKGYLALNERLIQLRTRLWGQEPDRDVRLAYFLYQGMAKFVQEPNNYNRYWLMVTRFDEDSDEVTWSGHPEIRVGDIIFYYQALPVSAITDIFKIYEEPWFDPWFPWGFVVKMRRIGQLNPTIPFRQLKNDPVISQWNMVKKNFVGVRTEAVPHHFYNQLLDFLPESLKIEQNLVKEPVASSKAGVFKECGTEKEFDEQFIKPLIRSWGFQPVYHEPCRLMIGASKHTIEPDFVVRHNGKILTIFEDKVRIISKTERETAARQGRSYARLMKSPTYVVAAPEGMWLYRSDDDDLKEIASFLPGNNEDKQPEVEFRKAILAAG